MLNMFMHMQVFFIEDHLGLLLVLRTSAQCESLAGRQSLEFHSLNLTHEYNRGNLVNAWLSCTNCRVAYLFSIGQPTISPYS